MRTRRATVDDVPELAALARAAYAGHVPRIGREPAPMTADYAASVARDEVWVAESEAGAAGLLVLVLAADHVLLENVAVAPSAQGRGVGSVLLALAEERARARGREEVRLYTNQAMTGNVAWYARLGYRETGRGEQDGFRRVHMAKRLS